MFRELTAAALTVAILLVVAGARADENPYSAPPGLAREQLIEFISKMQAKPKSVQRRPGFWSAVVEAADRVLSEKTDDQPATSALFAKFAALHAQAVGGEAAADEKLKELADAWIKDSREPIADEAKFHALEQRTLAAAETPPAELPPLVDELKKFFAGHEPQGRHLRMASATVGLVNRIPDAQSAAAAYKELGDAWAKSKDPELARYGRKIAKGPKPAGGGGTNRPN